MKLMRYREVNSVGTATNINFIGKLRIQDVDVILGFFIFVLFMLRMISRKEKAKWIVKIFNSEEILSESKVFLFIFLVSDKHYDY